MRNGKYEVTKAIHTFSCEDGHLRVAIGTQIIVDNGTAIAANSTRFPARLLDTVKDCLKEIN